MVRAELAIALLALATTEPAPATARVLDALGHAAQPSIVKDPAGGFLLGWQARLEDGCTALRVAPLSADGEPEAAREVARGCDWFVNWADFPTFAIADNGDWQSFYLRRLGEGGLAYHVYQTRSTDRGRSWSTPARLHEDLSETEHGFVAFAPAGGDRVLAVWLDGRHTGQPDSSGHDHGHGAHGAMTLRSALIGRDGVVGPEVEIDDRVCSCCPNGLVRVADRHLMIYRDRSPTEIRDIGLAEFVNNAWQQRGLVNEDRYYSRGCPVNGGALAARGPQVLAIWPTLVDGSQIAVRIRALDEAGTVTGAMHELEASAAALGRVSAAALADSWLVSWLGAGAEAGTTALKLARLNPDLEVVSTRTVATLTAGRDLGMPKLASDGSTAVLVYTVPDPTRRTAEGRAVTRIAIHVEGFEPLPTVAPATAK